MSKSYSPDDGEDFGTALKRLLQRAHDNGVDLEGGWKCTLDGNGHSHWDVQITRVEYDD